MTQAKGANDGRFVVFLNDEGEPPHGDECAVCQPFSRQRPDETRRDWLDRIAADGRADLELRMDEWTDGRLDGNGY